MAKQEEGGGADGAEQPPKSCMTASSQRERPCGFRPRRRASFSVRMGDLGTGILTRSRNFGNLRKRGQRSEVRGQRSEVGGQRSVEILLKTLLECASSRVKMTR